MLKEVIEGLDIKKDGIYVDCTIGGAGHSLEIVKRLKNGKLYGFDRDSEAIETSRERLKDYADKVVLTKMNYKDAPSFLKENGIEKIDGVLIDLGISSYQIDEGKRGFSFLHNGRLDMRMGQDEDTLTAFDIVNFYSEEKLIDVFYKYGEEEFAKVIAKNIVKKRQEKQIETTF